jgi:hypothetical protein
MAKTKPSTVREDDEQAASTQTPQQGNNPTQAGGAQAAAGPKTVEESAKKAVVQKVDDVSSDSESESSDEEHDSSEEEEEVMLPTSGVPQHSVSLYNGEHVGGAGAMFNGLLVSGFGVTNEQVTQVVAGAGLGHAINQLAVPTMGMASLAMKYPTLYGRRTGRKGDRTKVKNPKVRVGEVLKENGINLSAWERSLRNTASMAGRHVERALNEPLPGTRAVKEFRNGRSLQWQHKYK